MYLGVCCWQSTFIIECRVNEGEKGELVKVKLSTLLKNGINFPKINERCELSHVNTEYSWLYVNC